MAKLTAMKRQTGENGEESSLTTNTSLARIHDPQISEDSTELDTIMQFQGANTQIEQYSEDASKTPAAATDFQRPYGKIRWGLVTLGFCLGAFLYGLDTTIAAAVQGPILVSLGEIEKLPWVGIGFPMGSVSVILLLGVMYGLFDIKMLYILSTLMFTMGSAICGAAPNMNAMICGRVLAGVGGAGRYVGALTYVSIFTSYKERPIYNALIGLCWGIGCIVGPAIGGGFTSSNATWRWAFYLNIPLTVCFTPIYVCQFPSFNPRPNHAMNEKISQIDWLGAVLNVLVFILFQVVLILSGSTWRWLSGRNIALWVVFGICLVAYILQQVYCIFTTPEHRLFPIQLLRHRIYVLLYIATACSATTTFLTIYYIPLFFQFTKGDTAIRAAVRILPFITSMVAFVMIGGGTLPKLGRYMPYYVISGVFMITGGALMHTVTSQTASGKIYGYQVLLGIGAGLTLQTAYTLIALKVQPGEVSAGICFINVGQIGSLTIALSIAGCIFQNDGFRELSKALRQFHFSDSDLRNALSGFESAIFADDGEILGIALAAIVRTVSKIWIMQIVAGAVGIVSGILMSPENPYLPH